MCVKPRKLNVSGFPSPRRFRFATANGPNSRRRVFSGCRWRKERHRSQRELPKPLRQLRPELFGIRLHLESQDDVVRKPHDDHVAAGSLPTPGLHPQVKGVVEIDVCQERRSTAALWRSFLHLQVLPILQHAGVQPFLDEPHDAPVRNPVLDELHQPFVRNSVEGTYDTLPIIRTFPRESRLSALAIRSTVNRSGFLGRSFGTVDGFSFSSCRTAANL